MYDLIFISETWLHDNIFSSEIIRNTSYVIFRHYRLSKHGGGVATLFKRNLRMKEVALPPEFTKTEIMCCDLLMSEKSYRVILGYRPPTGPSKETDDLFLRCLRVAASTTSNHLIILGDFNIPEIKWSKNEDFPDGSIANNFINFTNDFGLYQHVHSPTLGSNILDLILSQHKECVINVQNSHPFANSDHDSLTFEILSSKPNVHDEVTPTRNFKKGFYEKINAFLGNICWNDFFNDCANVQQFYDKFVSVLHNMIDLYVPFRKPRRSFRYPKHLLKLQSRKLKLWKATKFNNALKPKYNKLCTEIRNAINEVNANKERKLLDKGSDLKNFFDYVNSRIGSHPTIPHLDNQNTIIETDNTKAEIFNRFFSSVFVDDNNITPKMPSRPTVTGFRPTFDQDNVSKAMLKTRSSTTVDPQGFCTYFLKQIKNSIVLPLCKIFEVSYVTGALPYQWLEAVVIPIHKKGSRSSVDNYRPISLCSTICKLMESVINEYITSHLKLHGLLKLQQFGFQKNKSCALQLVDCVNKWTKSLDAKNPIDIVYIDFQKAFDSVVHSKLLVKLPSYSFPPLLLLWIKNFLLNRSQRVKINNALSIPLPVCSGVPQGSVLGPTLFLLYINDLVDVMKYSEIRMFADDLKIFNTADNMELLQEDLDNICLWAEAWQLPISYKKCNVLHLGMSNPKHAYKLGNIELDRFDVGCKDLGVFISKNLSSSIHCNNIVSKSSRISALIHRTFISKNPELMIKAFTIYVRPILEYASSVWNPHLLKDINNIENIQRRFTKRLAPKGLPYDKRLELFNLVRLELRRIHFDAILAFNIIRKNILPSEDFFTVSVGNTRSCFNSNLYTQKYNLDCRKFGFTNRCIKIWNFLPVQLRNSETVESLKKGLSKIDFGSFIRGRT